MFIRTTAINKVLKLNKFVRAVQGGTSAGKTYAILPILIDIAAKNPLTEISIVAESIPHLKRGAIKDFKKIMIETGRFVEERYNKSDFKYTFSNGSFIEFFSADTDAKLRGARRDWLYMNECNNLTLHSYTELASRTKRGVYLDWNPTSPFWFHEELQSDPDVDFLIINYKDNEACPQEALNFILKAKEKAEKGSPYWANWYRVYGLGEIGTLEGVIFNNWKQVDIIPEDAELMAFGLDWGFTNDPTAIIGVYRYNGDLYLNEYLYQTRLTNGEIINFIKSRGLQGYFIADSADPKSIQELSNAGLLIEPSKKGSDSIRASIDILQQYNLYITKASLNLIKELRNYQWSKDRNGKTLNVPEDSQNHGIDALRYVALNRLSKFENSGEYIFSDDDADYY